MRKRWERLSETNAERLTSADFELAAYRLVTEQVIYWSDRRSRAIYSTIERYFSSFADALNDVGLDVKLNPHFKFICAVPRFGANLPVSVQETLFALVLRKVYDAAIHSGDVNEGEYTIRLDELDQLYRDATQREFPRRGELQGIVSAMERYGIVRRIDDVDGEQPYDLVIRPAIVDILGEQALHRLDAYAKTGHQEDEVREAEDEDS